jgi:hypothetical protein
MAARSTTHTVAALAGLLVVLVVPAIISVRSFFIAHARGDQATYVALLSARMAERVYHSTAPKHSEVLAIIIILAVAIACALAWAGGIARQALSINDLPMPF